MTVNRMILEPYTRVTLKHDRTASGIIVRRLNPVLYWVSFAGKNHSERRRIAQVSLDELVPFDADIPAAPTSTSKTRLAA